MKEILTAIEGLEKKMIDAKAENKSAFDAQLKEVKDAFAAKEAALEAKVAQLNEDKIKAGATLEEIRKEVLELKAAKGRFKTDGAQAKKTAEIIAEAIEVKAAELREISTGQKVKLELKAVGTMTAANNLTGNVVATYNLTPAVRGRRKLNIRDLIPVIPSATGVWKFYSQNNPVGEGSIDFQSAAAAVKNQVDYDLTENTATCKFLAGFVRFDKGMASDVPFLQNFIASELVEDYKRAESAVFFPLLTAAATGSTTTGATVLAEKYIDYIATLKSTDYDPSAIITTAANWATILKTKPNDYGVPGGITIDADGTIMFAGIPLLAQNNVASGKTLIGDFSKAAIIQQEGLSVNFYEQDSDNVQRNLITARIEARVALATLRPDAFVYA